jgi:ribonuclease HI
MKKLKLDHETAEQVLKGEQWSTWRLFDDKDLSVNDGVELIDKVQPDNPETWHPIGIAVINKIIEKRLGDITPADAAGGAAFSSPDDMLRTFKQYYGPTVTLATPVKMVHFDFQPMDASELRTGGAREEKQLVEAVKVFADGGSRGNPGPSASGYVLLDMNNTVLVDKGIYLGITTNNQAEYQALKFALEEAQKMHVRRVDVYMDSLLVINQMKDIYKVKNRDLWPIHEAVKQLASAFDHISFTQIPRELNRLADSAVNRALDDELGKSSKKMA